MADGKSPYVLVSIFKEDANQQDVEQTTSKIATMIDEWNIQGNMIWSGSFNDGNASMSVIEGSKIEAESFFTKYDSTCKSFLSSYMYQWDAMPILSLLGRKQTVTAQDVAAQ